MQHAAGLARASVGPSGGRRARPPRRRAAASICAWCQASVALRIERRRAARRASRVRCGWRDTAREGSRLLAPSDLTPRSPPRGGAPSGSTARRRGTRTRRARRRARAKGAARRRYSAARSTSGRQACWPQYAFCSGARAQNRQNRRARGAAQQLQHRCLLDSVAPTITMARRAARPSSPLSRTSCSTAAADSAAEGLGGRHTLSPALASMPARAPTRRRRVRGQRSVARERRRPKCDRSRGGGAHWWRRRLSAASARRRRQPGRSGVRRRRVLSAARTVAVRRERRRRPPPPRRRPPPPRGAPTLSPREERSRAGVSERGGEVGQRRERRAEGVEEDDRREDRPMAWSAPREREGGAARAQRDVVVGRLS